MKTQLTIPSQPIFGTTYHLHILGICLCMITACSLFKEKSFVQTDSLSRQKINTQVKSEAHLHSRVIRMYNSLDSSDKGSYTEIFPEGVFTYSAAEGFSGKAAKLVLKEHTKTSSRQVNKILESQSGSFRTDLKTRSQDKVKTRLKEKKLELGGLSILYLLGCLLLFAAIYFSRRFLEKRVVPGKLL